MHAYLLDRYVYSQAIAEAAPALVGAYEGAASRIAGECPGVLAGVHQDTDILAAPSTLPETARQQGEEKRQRTQLSDLEVELGSELGIAEQEPRRPAVTAFLANLKALPQSDPMLSYVLHAETIGLEEDLQAESTDVCADMKAWAGSGYRMLTPASRAIALKGEADFPELLRGLSVLSADEFLSAAETPADKALAGKTTQLELQTAKTIANSIRSARDRVEAVLGLRTREDREKVLGPILHESKSSTEISSGRTEAGTSYTIWLERKKGGFANACKSRVEVKAQDTGPTIVQIITSGESEDCLEPRKDRSEGASVKCNEGLLKIKAEMLSATRTVDLRMSNGTQILSRPALVPRRLGGPDAFYYQAVRGPSPIPVSLTERDSRGRTLRVLKLQRIVGCSKHPLKYLPGGERTLVRGETPQGPDFSIVGERYRLFGRIHTQLKLKAGKALLGSGESEEEGAEGPEESFAVPVKRTTPLDSEISTDCRPHEYSIFYGLLDKPRDTVFAKISGTLVPLSRVPIPASLHADGVLVYVASIGQPEETLVRSSNGKVVMSEDLSSQATKGRETCEGESEGSAGPPPGGFGETSQTSRIVLNSRAPAGLRICSSAKSRRLRLCSTPAPTRPAARPTPSQLVGTRPRQN
ncbi:MAG TPA: hypothetical protein VK730_12835 [Solirubrobacteraceae bacterium]|nr:hypothetical protein [Solirubrobacteraceae bacterium]